MNDRVLNGRKTVRSNTWGLRSSYDKYERFHVGPCAPQRSHPHAGTCSALRRAPNRRVVSGFNVYLTTSFRSLTTLPHFSFSATRKTPNAFGSVATTSVPAR